MLQIRISILAEGAQHLPLQRHVMGADPVQRGNQPPACVRHAPVNPVVPVAENVRVPYPIENGVLQFIPVVNDDFLHDRAILC